MTSSVMFYMSSCTGDLSVPLTFTTYVMNMLDITLDIIGHFNEDPFMLQKDSTVLCNEIPRERFRSFRKTSPFCSSQLRVL